VGWLTILQPGHRLSVLDQIYVFWPGQLQSEFTPMGILKGCQIISLCVERACRYVVHKSDYGWAQ